MKRIALPLVVAASLGAAGCANNEYGYGPGEVVGTVGGAAIGGAIGSQLGDGTGKVLATGGGAVLGGILGNTVGRSADQGTRY